MHGPAILVLFGVTGCCGWLVFPLLGTARKDGWGINLGRVSCPECGERLPVFFPHPLLA